MNLRRFLTNYLASLVRNSTCSCPFLLSPPISAFQLHPRLSAKDFLFQASLRVSARADGNPTCVGKSGPPPLLLLRSLNEETNCAVSRVSLLTPLEANPTCFSPLRVTCTFRICIGALRHNTSVPDSKAPGASFSCPRRNMGF